MNTLGRILSIMLVVWVVSRLLDTVTDDISTEVVNKLENRGVIIFSR